MISTAYYENNKLEEKKTISYNLDGNVTDYKIYDKSGKIIQHRKRSYDVKGNLKSDILDDKASGKIKFTYNIKYY